MLAYSYDTYDHGMHIIFAENEQDAIELADKESGVEEVKRAEIFDKYAPGPIQDVDFLNEGWTIGCTHCEHRLCGYECESCETSVIIDGHAVFCNEECMEDYKAEKARIKEKKQKATEKIQKRLPFVTIERAWVGGTGSCKNKCYDKDHENICVDLHFEGEKYNNSTYCDGCGKMWVANGDLKAYNAALNKWKDTLVQPDAIVNCTKKD